jgi:hypothetical protein
LERDGEHGAARDFHACRAESFGAAQSDWRFRRRAPRLARQIGKRNCAAAEQLALG